jgi:hypothetical protein
MEPAERTRRLSELKRIAMALQIQSARAQSSYDSHGCSLNR